MLILPTRALWKYCTLVNKFSITLALVHLTSWRREKELIYNKENKRVVIRVRYLTWHSTTQSFVYQPITIVNNFLPIKASGLTFCVCYLRVKSAPLTNFHLN